MMNYAGNIYEKHMDEIYKTMNISNRDDAFYIMLEQFAAKGRPLPFNSIEEFWNWAEQQKQVINKSNEDQKERADKIMKLERVKNYQAKKGYLEDFRQLKGRYKDSDEQAFERLQRVRPGIFERRKEVEEFAEMINNAFSAQ